MKFLHFSICLVLLGFTSNAETIIVKNIGELNAAGKRAKPGDVIVLQNGEWKDVVIKIQSKGSQAKPITYKAETPGKLIISGNSRLALGGEYNVVEGLFFKNGFAGDRAVIEFRASKDELANNCRVTNCAIDNFNNAKRLDENNWVLFYGKNNRLDHCSFKDKNNLGVLLAVILDDDRSRENFHSIDHNYFGRRLPLASNGGEIIRVGVSQHCQFNSNTRIVDNFFEHCDGETEVISIKSGSNLVKGNLFKECQGSVVLRHGDYNTVENNIFLGNNKQATGGVRVINKGQWVVNNLFYKCRGVDFRSPLAIMNGIVNSPANRYVQVTDAVIANNTFMECTPISFGEGSDAERTLPPDNVLLINNVIYNTTDPTIYHVYDNTNGIRFIGNETNSSVKRTSKSDLDKNFVTRTQKLIRTSSGMVALSLIKGAVSLSDSLGKISQARLGRWLSTKPGFTDLELLKTMVGKSNSSTGAAWFDKNEGKKVEPLLKVDCSSTEEIYRALEKNTSVMIYLTASKYVLDKPLVITSIVAFSTKEDRDVVFETPQIKTVFQLTGNGSLYLNNISFNGKNVKSKYFISTDENGPSGHVGLFLTSCTFKNFQRHNGSEDLFFAYKSTVADFIIALRNKFENNNIDLFMMNEEKDDKGYYNAEHINFSENNFTKHQGIIASIYRGGNDESTLGPSFIFEKNKLTDCNSGDQSLFTFTGVQLSKIISNEFTNCNPNGILVRYQDTVRARHYIESNKLKNSGRLEKNKFVLTDANNSR